MDNLIFKDYKGIRYYNYGMDFFNHILVSLMLMMLGLYWFNILLILLVMFHYIYRINHYELNI